MDAIYDRIDCAIATVEEHTERPWKVVVFKRKKKRKGYLRKKNFVPELTMLRILDIEHDFENVNMDG